MSLAAALLLVGCAGGLSLPSLPRPKLPALRIPTPDLAGLNPFAEEASPAVPPDPSYGLEVLTPDGVVAAFHARAESFYGQLALRRFNSILTYRDPGLREFFRNDEEFADYYADFAYSLETEYVAKNRPLRLEVVEFSLAEPGVAIVDVRISGDDDKPLRYGQVTYERQDRWERHNGQWWIVPGKF